MAWRITITQSRRQFLPFQFSLLGCARSEVGSSWYIISLVPSQKFTGDRLDLRGEAEDRRSP